MRTIGRLEQSRRRRWWWRLSLAAVLVPLLFAGWLLSHLISRHRYFLERRGELAQVSTTIPVIQANGSSNQSVHLEAGNGLAVDLRVLRRTGLDQKLPVIVLLGGHGTGRNAVDVIGNPGTLAVVALDYPYRGPERTHGVIETVRAIPAAQRAVLDTPAAVSLALDWLRTCDWVDPARVELMGVSLGVPFAAAAGALDDRFRRVWLAHGGVGNREWIAQRLESRITNGPLRHATAALVHLLAYGASFKTEEWARRIAPRPVVIIGATADEEMSREHVELLYAAALPPKELLWTEGGHVRPDRADIVRQLIQLVRERIEMSARVAVED